MFALWHIHPSIICMLSPHTPSKSHSASKKTAHLLLGHPSIGLLSVSDKKLQVHALFIQDAFLFPQFQQASLFTLQDGQLQHITTSFNNVDTFLYFYQIHQSTVLFSLKLLHPAMVNFLYEKGILLGMPSIPLFALQMLIGCKQTTVGNHF